MQDGSKPIWFDKQEELTINVGEPKYKLFVATPVHSEVSIHYAQALLKFQQLCIKHNILVSFALLKSSLVTQGRNLCVANFLGDTNHKYTHLLFIDSDIDFQFKSIKKMLELDKDVIGVPYPMKHIDWGKIWRKIQEGKITNEKELQRAGYIFPIKAENHKNDIISFVEGVEGLMELSHIPTGCTLFKREVFDKMIEKYPELKINQPTIVNGEAKEHPFMYNFFDTIHDSETKKYYGEDFGFCRKWTQIGGKCYAYIPDDITHVGEYQFCGRLMDYVEYEKEPTKTVDLAEEIK